MGVSLSRKRNGSCFSGLICQKPISAEEIYKIAEESVCPVLFEVGGERIGSGSSFIYKQCISSNGSKLYFLTNLHVIQSIHDLVGILNYKNSKLDYRVYVKFKGRDYDIDATFVPPWDIYKEFIGKYDSNFRFDFSVFVIKVEDLEPVKFFSIKNPLSVTEGAEVYALGYPKGLELSISNGIVSHIYDNQEMLLEENKEYINTIQHNILINPGNSGGPTVNKYGEIIGISTFGEVRRKDISEIVSGLNFSVDMRFILELLQKDFLVKFNLKEYVENNIGS